MHIQACLLGPVAVEIDGQSAQLGGAKERTVLAVLAASAGRPVSTFALIDRVWGDDPPRTATKTVQTYVARLRRALGATINSVADGYKWTGGVDVSDAMALIERARSERALGNGEQAVGLFDDALGLWRGDVLSGAESTAWVIAERTRLEEVRLLACEERVDVLLGSGRHADAVVDLERMVGESPLRERYWAQLVTALYRSGRQGEALRTFQRLRTSLVEELGVEPSRELQELEARVLGQDATLDLEVPVSRPSAKPSRLPGRAAAEGPSQPSRRPLPFQLARPPENGFLGRTDELARLVDAYEGVAGDGGRAVVLVSGEPGAGKTTLVAEIARRGHSAGAVILYGAADQNIPIPYRPVLQALKGIVETADVPQHLPGSHGDDPETQRYLFHEAVDSLLRSAGPQPVVAIFEDLHWADTPTVGLLRHLAVGTEPWPLLLVLTYRGAEVTLDHPLQAVLGDIARGGELVRIDDLAGWTEPEVVAFLHTRVKDSTGPDTGRLARTLIEDSGGNPLFVTEIVRHLSAHSHAEEAGTALSAARYELLRDELPATVRDVILQRTSAVGDQVRSALLAASVIGREFDLAILSELTGLDYEPLLDLLDRAAAASLVTASDTTGHLAFGHALYQHALYQQLGPSRAATMHRRVAEILEQHPDQQDADAAQTAHHWSLAMPADPAKIVAWALRAGNAGLKALAPEEARRWFEHGLAYLPQLHDGEETLRCDLLIGLGQAQRQAGDATYRQTLLDAARLARDLRDTDRMSHAVLSNARRHATATAPDPEGVELLRDALAGASRTADRACLMATLGLELMFTARYEDRSSLVGAAAALAPEIADPMERLAVLNLLIEDHVAESFAARGHWTAEAVALARELGDPLQEFYASLGRFAYCMDAGDRDQSEQHLQICRTIAERVRPPALAWWVQAIDSTMALLDGDLGIAEERAQRAAETGFSGGLPDASLTLAAHIFEIRRHHDELAALEEQWVAAARLLPNLAAVRAELALLHVAMGEEARAIELVERDAADGFDTFLHSPLRLQGLCRYAEACGAIVRVPGAIIRRPVLERLYELLAPWEHLIAHARVVNRGSVALYVGILARALGRPADAEQHLDRALRSHERLRAPLLGAQTQIELARVVGAQDGRHDVERARALLAEAAETGTRHGSLMVRRTAAETEDDLSLGASEQPI